MAFRPKDSILPIGLVISIHPEVTDLPDSNYWASCDGIADLGYLFATPTTKVPDLTDTRFLMGVSGTTGSSSGVNVLTDHTHTMSIQDTSHSHSVNLAAKTSGGYSANHCHLLLYNTVGGDLVCSSAKYITKGASVSSDSDYLMAYTSTVPTLVRSKCGSADHSHTTNYACTVSGIQSASHSHTVGSGSVPSSTSKIPRYFTVKYYMRIK